MLIENGGQGAGGASPHGRVGGIGIRGEGSSPGRHGRREGGNRVGRKRYGCHVRMVGWLREHWMASVELARVFGDARNEQKQKDQTQTVQME